jgi:hypothetical protein
VGVRIDESRGDDEPRRIDRSRRRDTTRRRLADECDSIPRDTHIRSPPRRAAPVNHRSAANQDVHALLRAKQRRQEHA